MLNVDPSLHRDVQDLFPGFDYHNPTCDRGRFSMRRPDNIVGHLQRALTEYWGHQLCSPTDKGLDIGCGQCVTTGCEGVDFYRGDNHPHYGGGYYPDFQAQMEDLAHAVDRNGNVVDLRTGTRPYIASNHSIEHIQGDVATVLRTQWGPCLRPGGILAIVTPDQHHCDMLKIDVGHHQVWTCDEFKSRVIDAVADMFEVVEWPAIYTDFSFGAVLRKR